MALASALEPAYEEFVRLPPVHPVTREALANPIVAAQYVFVRVGWGVGY